MAKTTPKSSNPGSMTNTNWEELSPIKKAEIDNISITTNKAADQSFTALMAPTDDCLAEESH